MAQKQRMNEISTKQSNKKCSFIIFGKTVNVYAYTIVVCVVYRLCSICKCIKVITIVMTTFKLPLPPSPPSVPTINKLLQTHLYLTHIHIAVCF